MNPNITTSATPGAVRYPVAVTMVLLAGTFWSFIAIGIRGFSEANVWQILFYRSMGMLPLVFALIYFQSKGRPVIAIRACGASGVLGAIGLVAAYAGGIAAIRLTTIANAAFIFATAPFIAAVLGRLFLQETIRRSTVIALVIATLGIAIMVYDNFSRGNWIGDILALLSAVGFAVFTIALRATKSGNSLPIVLLGSLFAMALSFLLASGSEMGISIPTHEILLALALGAFILGTGMALCTWGSTAVPAAELALLCMTEVVLAPIWAWLFLSETPSMSVIVGGAVVICAIILNAVTGIRRKPVPTTQ